MLRAVKKNWTFSKCVRAKKSGLKSGDKYISKKKKMFLFFLRFLWFLVRRDVAGFWKFSKCVGAKKSGKIIFLNIF